MPPTILAHVNPAALQPLRFYWQSMSRGQDPAPPPERLRP